MAAERRTSLARCLEGFFREALAEQRKASPATIANYRDALKLLLVFAAKRCEKAVSGLTVADLEAETVVAFLKHLEEERGNSIRTRNARRTAIRSFFHHVAAADPPSAGIAERVLMIPAKLSSRPTIEFLRDAEQEAILHAPDCSRSAGRRDHALLLFLIRTGARESEAIAVNVGDLRLMPPLQVKLFGKGSKERLVPLCEQTVAVLAAHLREHGKSRPEEAVFENQRGARLTRHGVIHIVRRAAAAAAKAQPSFGQRSISPHVLRHTCGMNLLHRGVDVTTIQSWLGHVSLQTTHDYVEADVEMKRGALDKCPMTDTVPKKFSAKDPILALLESF